MKSIQLFIDLPSLKIAQFGPKAFFGRRERRDTGSIDLSCMSFRGEDWARVYDGLDLPSLEHLYLNNNFVFYRKVVMESKWMICYE